MPKLTISPEDAPSFTQDLEEVENSVITIGRAADNIIQIDDVSVSSHHAQITKDGDTWKLKDLNSTNGTSHNGLPIDGETSLSNSDSLRFGKISAKYETGEPSEHRPLPEAGHASAELSDESRRPSNFENASPFKKKIKKKDPLGQLTMAAAAIAILSFLVIGVQLLLLSPAP